MRTKTNKFLENLTKSLKRSNLKRSNKAEAQDSEGMFTNLFDELYDPVLNNSDEFSLNTNKLSITSDDSQIYLKSNGNILNSESVYTSDDEQSLKTQSDSSKELGFEFEDLEEFFSSQRDNSEVTNIIETTEQVKQENKKQKSTQVSQESNISNSIQYSEEDLELLSQMILLNHNLAEEQKQHELTLETLTKANTVNQEYEAEQQRLQKRQEEQSHRESPDSLWITPETESFFQKREIVQQTLEKITEENAKLEEEQQKAANRRESKQHRTIPDTTVTDYFLSMIGLSNNNKSQETLASTDTEINQSEPLGIHASRVIEKRADTSRIIF